MWEYLYVCVELNIVNWNVDFVVEGFDLVICLGELLDSGLVVCKFEDVVLCLVVLFEYVVYVGMFGNVVDLEYYFCLLFMLFSSGCIVFWVFCDGDWDIDWLLVLNVVVFDDVFGVVLMV